MTAANKNAFYTAKCPHCQNQQLTSYQEIVDRKGMIVCQMCIEIFAARGNLVKPTVDVTPASVSVTAISDMPTPIQTENRVANILHKVKDDKNKKNEILKPRSAQETLAEEPVKVMKKASIFSRFLKRNNDEKVEVVVQQPTSTYSAISPETEALTQKYLKAVAAVVPDGKKAPVFDLVNLNATTQQDDNAFVLIKEGNQLTPVSKSMVYTLENGQMNSANMTKNNQYTNNEINWMNASITALIVLIIQLFYLVLDK